MASKLQGRDQGRGTVERRPFDHATPKAVVGDDFVPSSRTAEAVSALHLECNHYFGGSRRFVGVHLGSSLMCSCGLRVDANKSSR